ncbi:hypothetical protein CUR178_04764 [Leishmania enriettii]|uniref:Uncharacterized protein n=1 Tax=Leishmania enriettii TaxID=5663 RepID=A0A836KQK4_LEIEN|nr:hypothetical protein CUR178_04764 [Leishmania enriettii]
MDLDAFLNKNNRKSAKKVSKKATDDAALGGFGLETVPRVSNGAAKAVTVVNTGGIDAPAAVGSASPLPAPEKTVAAPVVAVNLNITGTTRCAKTWDTVKAAQDSKRQEEAQAMAEQKSKEEAEAAERKVVAGGNDDEAQSPESSPKVAKFVARGHRNATGAIGGEGGSGGAAASNRTAPRTQGLSLENLPTLEETFGNARKQAQSPSSESPQKQSATPPPSQEQNSESAPAAVAQDSFKPSPAPATVGPVGGNKYVPPIKSNITMEPSPTSPPAFMAARGSTGVYKPPASADSLSGACRPPSSGSGAYKPPSAGAYRPPSTSVGEAYRPAVPSAPSAGAGAYRPPTAGGASANVYRPPLSAGEGYKPPESAAAAPSVGGYKPPSSGGAGSYKPPATGSSSAGVYRPPGTGGSAGVYKPPGRRDA